MITITLKDKILEIPEPTFKQYSQLKGILLRILAKQEDNKEIDVKMLMVVLNGDEKMFDITTSLLKSSKYDGKDIKEEDFSINGLFGGVAYEHISAEILVYITKTLDSETSDSGSSEKKRVLP